jgi:hypothetical protein
MMLYNLILTVRCGGKKQMFGKMQLGKMVFGKMGFGKRVFG